MESQYNCVDNRFFTDVDKPKSKLGQEFISPHLPKVKIVPEARIKIHPLPKVSTWGGWVGGPCDFSVSPWSKSFFFPFLGDFYSTWGPVGTGARTWTWTRA